MYIGIDFDGTVVKHRYPEIGEDIGAVPVLKTLVNNGHKLIINSMRYGQTLKEAHEWFINNGIEIFGINHNPTQDNWTMSSKAYAQLYIDDAGLGCPCKIDEEGRKYVDWVEVEDNLKANGIL